MYYTDTTSFFAENNSSSGGIDSFTKVMLHLNGNITDSALTPNTFTNVGSVAFTSTNPPFTGTQWAVFDGAGSKQLTTPANTAFDLGTGDWTLDFVIKWNSHLATGLFLSDETDANNYIAFEWATAGGGGLYFLLASGGVITQKFHCSFSPIDGTKYHIAFVRNGANGLIFVNGVSQTVTIDNALGTIAHQTGTLKVGFNTNITNDPDATLAEIRFSVGIARWTSNFTPPTSPYTT